MWWSRVFPPEITIFIFIHMPRNKATASPLVIQSLQSMSSIITIFVTASAETFEARSSLTGSSAGASGRRRWTETVDTGVALAKMHEDGSAPGNGVGGSRTWASSMSTCQKLHVPTCARLLIQLQPQCTPEGPEKSIEAWTRTGDPYKTARMGRMAVQGTPCYHSEPSES
jgi:hypothetical protein